MLAALQRVGVDAEQAEQAASTVVATRSRSSSASSRTAAGGAANDCRIETGSPALLPGV